jgi:hypothetical protein
MDETRVGLTSATPAAVPETPRRRKAAGESGKEPARRKPQNTLDGTLRQAMSLITSIPEGGRFLVMAERATGSGQIMTVGYGNWGEV